MNGRPNIFLELIIHIIRYKARDFLRFQHAVGSLEKNILANSE